MSWLAPIGFLGLLGIVALIIIYIIKPNFQNKMISSTFVWQLSLKYRKKRLPVSKLSNILIFICQVLILATCALLLARPVIMNEKLGDERERVIIIDASASMRLEEQGSTRFERAVAEAKDLVTETYEKGGVVSLILADSSPEFLAQRYGKDRGDEVMAALDELAADEKSCTYSSADMDGAVTLAEEVLRYNNEAQLFLVTATTYIEKGSINVRNVSVEGEWNATIIGARAEYNENNHYQISVDLGCYGRTELLTLHVDIYGANKDKRELKLSRTGFFDPTAQEQTMVFTTDDMDGVALTSFDSMEIYVSVDDSFNEDNSFFLYGGKKPVIKVQYASSKPNNYFAGVVRTLRENMKDKWKIEYTELKADQKGATEGFDLYIYEHRMPEVLPTDGVVLLVDPTSSPDGAGIRFGSSYGVDKTTTLATGQAHELTKFVDSSNITIAKYTEIQSYDGYTELAYHNGAPVMLVKEDEGAKVVVWAFDLNYSNIIARPEFSILVYNMFNYFIPSTMSSYYYEIGESVDLSARGSELKVSNSHGDKYDFTGSKTGTIEELTVPGSYTVTQKPMSGEALIIDSFFVKIPSSESNITKQVDSLPIPDAQVNTAIEFEDLLFYFAIALVSLMFAEWALQTKKNY